MCVYITNASFIASRVEIRRGMFRGDFNAKIIDVITSELPQRCPLFSDGFHFQEIHAAKWKIEIINLVVDRYIVHQ